MPITYAFDTKRSLINTKVSGILSMEDTIAYFEELQKNPLCPARAIEIVDFSEATDFVLQYSQMRSITQNYQLTKKTKEIVATVFLCPSDLSYGIGRMLQVLHHMNNPDHVVEVIKNRDELEEFIRKKTI